jgi:NAD dependent epimerase/dehydratase family enzyme
LSWISLADEVGVILHALDDPSLSGPVNAAAPAPVTNRVFTRALGHALHRPAVLSVPGFALRIVLGPDLATELVLAGQRVAPTRLTATGYSFRHADVDTALAAVLTPGS